MKQRRQMRLGASMRGLGYHVSAWLHPEVPANGSETFSYYAQNAQIAEAGKFDLIFFADLAAVRLKDSPAGSLCRSHDNVHLEPLTLLAALSTVTSRIGLVATASTTYNEPYHIARKFASIDHISGGRAGWNVVTSWSDLEAQNFGSGNKADHAVRYQRAAEFLDITNGLWDSWDEDAFLYDKNEGTFFDPTKMHVLDHHGRFFHVRGPLTASRMPQGRPVIFQAGASREGVELAARYADVVYSIPQEMAGSQRFRSELRRRASEFGRASDDIKVLPGVHVVVGRNEGEAHEKHRFLREIVDPLSGLARLEGLVGDLSGYDLDEPLPPRFHGDGSSAASSVMANAPRFLEVAKARNWTLRRLCQEIGVGLHRVLVGSPEQVVEDMQAWFERDACDGFNILPSHLPGGLRDFVELVVPILQDRGLFRREYEAETLRGNLGLPPAPSRDQLAQLETLKRVTSPAKVGGPLA